MNVTRIYIFFFWGGLRLQMGKAISFVFCPRELKHNFKIKLSHLSKIPKTSNDLGYLMMMFFGHLAGSPGSENSILFEHFIW